MQLIIDGSSLIFRTAWVKRPAEMSLTFLNLRSLRRLIMHLNPTFVMIVWDGKHSAWRTNLYPAYKERKEEPTEMLLKIYESSTDLQDLLTAFPIFQWRLSKYEADDLICAAVLSFASFGQPCVIASTDRDFLQLLGMSNFYSLSKSVLYSAETFAREFKFSYHQWPSYRALVGDASDQIGGVKGIGAKTAQCILEHYESVDALADDERAPRKFRRKLLLEQREIFERNLKLVDLLRFPDRAYLQKQLIKELIKFTPKLDDETLKCQFSERGFQLLLDNFRAWIAPFNLLVRSSFGKGGNHGESNHIKTASH